MSDREFGEWPLQRLMSEVVGSGPKTADDMSYDQAKEAFERILAGEPDPVTLGGFWTANRWKRNVPVELAGFVDAMRERSVEAVAPDTDPVDCGANYDGKRETALLGVAAGVVAAAAGTPVVAHSAGRVPTTRGATYRDVLDELGVPTDLEPAESAAMVDEVGFGFYDATRFNPGVDALGDRRDALGVRTFVNTVETLANPADAGVHLGSFFHLSFARKVVETLRESRRVDLDRAVLFQGQEGYDDVRPGTIRVAEWSGTEIEDYEVDTEAFGLAADADLTADGDLAAASADLVVEAVAGERDGPVADAVALNAGLRIYAGADARTLDDAVADARDAVADGSAADRLDALRAFDPRGA